MAKSTTASKPRKVSQKTATAKTAKQPLVELAKTATEKKINGGGLDLDATLINNTGKVARAAGNAERHLTLSGKTVRDALATRLVDARDIRYDVDKGFMTLQS